MKIQTRVSWAATAIAALALVGCGGSDGLAPGMPDNIDMSKVTPMPGGAAKDITKDVAKQARANKAR